MEINEPFEQVAEHALRLAETLDTVATNLVRIQRQMAICLAQAGDKFENSEHLVLEDTEGALAGLMVLLGVQPHVEPELPYDDEDAAEDAR